MTITFLLVCCPFVPFVPCGPLGFVLVFFFWAALRSGNL